MSPLDPFIPAPDARERFAVRARAPAALVYQTACAFDMQSIWSVRTIFRMRERIMGSRVGTRVPRGLVEELRGLGWGCLLERPGELFVGGAVCQPWLADVKFSAQPSYPPFDLEKDAPVVAHAKRAAELIGLKPTTVFSNGGLDANWFTKHGLPTVTIGAG